MISRNEITCIGRFVKAHGVNGELLASIKVPAEVLEGCRCVVCDIDGCFVPFFITGMRVRSHETVLLGIDGIATEGDTALLTGRDIFILNSDSTAWDDEGDIAGNAALLSDFSVDINGGEMHGVVDGIDDTTANVLIHISLTNGDTVMVPAVEEFVRAVDFESRRIELQVPQELLEL